MSAFYTFFPAFDSTGVNSSQAVARLLSKLGKQTVMLPNSLASLPDAVNRILAERGQDQVLVMLGQDGRFSIPTLERMATNWLDLGVRQDEDGHSPSPGPIEVGGPECLVTAVDVYSVALAASRAGHLALVSHSAGVNICNLSYYLALSTTRCPVVFVHLPYIESQIGQLSDQSKPVTKSNELAMTCSYIGDYLSSSVPNVDGRRIITSS